MSRHREMLEGEAYWGRIRGIKRRLFVLELILIAVLGSVLIFFSSEFQTNPFFIPFDSLLWFIIIMAFVIEIEGFVFRIMQVRIAKSDSTKHLMTINSIRKAMVIIIASALIATMFLVPAIADGIEGSLTVRGEIRPDSPRQFLPSDPLGLSRVITVSVQCDVVAEVYIVSTFNYDLHKGNWLALKGSALNNRTIVDLDHDLVILMPNVTYATFYLLIDPTSSVIGNQTAASYSLEMQLSDTLTSFAPLMAIIFLIANAVWIVYLFPLGRKYAHGSIYK
jgi:hypothetical protein